MNRKMNVEWNRAIEHAATECEVSVSELLLALGEMTAGERRAAKATCSYLAARIRSLADAATSQDSSPTKYSKQ